MMTKILLAASAACLLAMPASAYTVKANIDCPDVLKEDANPTFSAQNHWWVLGYITARNFEADADVGKGVDNDTIYQMLIEYCTNNPNDDIDDASIFIYESLK